MTNLIILTEKLINHLDILKHHFEQNERPVTDKDYFLFVKEETEPIFKTVEKWEEMALYGVKTQKCSLHPQQITSTKENMEALILHSYYIDVRKRRYMEMNKSCHYIFNQLLKEFHHEK